MNNNGDQGFLKISSEKIIVWRNGGNGSNETGDKWQLYILYMCTKTWSTTNARYTCHTADYRQTHGWVGFVFGQVQKLIAKQKVSWGSFYPTACMSGNVYLYNRIVLLLDQIL